MRKKLYCLVLFITIMLLIGCGKSAEEITEEFQIYAIKNSLEAVCDDFENGVKWYPKGSEEDYGETWDRIDESYKEIILNDDHIVYGTVDLYDGAYKKSIIYIPADSQKELGIEVEDTDYMSIVICSSLPDSVKFNKKDLIKKYDRAKSNDIVLDIDKNWFPMKSELEGYYIRTKVIYDNGKEEVSSEDAPFLVIDMYGNGFYEAVNTYKTGTENEKKTLMSKIITTTKKPSKKIIFWGTIYEDNEIDGFEDTRKFSYKYNENILSYYVPETQATFEYTRITKEEYEQKLFTIIPDLDVTSKKLGKGENEENDNENIELVKKKYDELKNWPSDYVETTKKDIVRSVAFLNYTGEFSSVGIVLNYISPNSGIFTFWTTDYDGIEVINYQKEYSFVENDDLKGVLDNNPLINYQVVLVYEENSNSHLRIIFNNLDEHYEIEDAKWSNNHWYDDYGYEDYYDDGY